MPPRRKVKVGTKGTPQKKATRTSSRKASWTNDEKEKTDDATKSSVPPGAIPSSDEYEYVATISLAKSSTNDKKGKTNDVTKSSIPPGADDDYASKQQDVTVSPSRLESIVEGMKRISRPIYEGTPEQLRNVTSKKPVGVTRDSLSDNLLMQKLDDNDEQSIPSVAAAASTLMYSKAYGVSGEELDDEDGSLDIADAATKLVYNEDGKEEEYNDDENEKKKEDSESEYSEYSDVITFDVDSDDDAMICFPKDKSKNRVYSTDGPQPPNLNLYPANERDEIWTAYKKKRKAFTIRIVRRGQSWHGIYSRVATVRIIPSTKVAMSNSYVPWTRLSQIG